MRIENIEIKNLLGISDLSIPTVGHNMILIGGENGQGKTSAITAFCMAICGRRGMDWPEIALKDGESEGEVTVVLNDIDPMAFPNTNTLRVRRIFDRARGGTVKDKLEIIDDSGEAAPEPQTILSNLFRAHGLDPMYIEGMRKPEQRAMLLKAVGLEAPLQALEDERDKLFEKRKQIGKDGTVAKSAAATMTVKDGIKPDMPLVDTNLLHSRLELATSNARELQLLQTAASDARRTAELEKRHSDELALAIDVSKKKLADLESAYIKSLAEVSDSEKAADEKESLVVRFDRIDATAIATALREATSTNSEIERAKQKHQYEAEAERLRSEYTKCTARLDQIENEKVKLIESTNWPVPGMIVDAEGVMIKGIPIEQCSTAQRIIAWTKVAIALNPDLRLIVIRNGNDLDNNSLAEMDAFLKANNYQALVEFVTRNPSDEQRCAVVIQDGHAKSI